MFKKISNSFYPFQTIFLSSFHYLGRYYMMLHILWIFTLLVSIISLGEVSNIWIFIILLFQLLCPIWLFFINHYHNEAFASDECEWLSIMCMFPDRGYFSGNPGYRGNVLLITTDVQVACLPHIQRKLPSVNKKIIYVTTSQTRYSAWSMILK